MKLYLFRYTCALLMLGSVFTLYAQTGIRYTVAFPNAVHHEAQVEARYSLLAKGPLRLHMSRSSPGRYATHEFGKNIYHLHAWSIAGGKETEVHIDRLEPDLYSIANPGAEVAVRYTLFGDLADGTYNQISTEHAHLNMPATFIWAEGLDALPITVHFDVPTGWQVATQLKPTTDSTTFTAPGLQVFMDSPTEISVHSLRTWTVPNGTTPANLRLEAHHTGSAADLDSFLTGVKKIVAEEQGIYGRLAPYDFGQYTFLIDDEPGNDDDGMEHRNSTCITMDVPLKQKPFGVVSHEFFHSWNVERMRPRTLEPFNFTHANMSGELWFAEGFTQYYGELVLRRAGLYTDADYGRSLGYMLGSVLNSPGTYELSPAEMSQEAPYVDASTYIDPVNFGNFYTSYYPYGGCVALALDLTLRTKYSLTLDGYMRSCWAAHPDVDKPYTIPDLEAHLAGYTHDAAFAKDFFSRFIQGHAQPDFTGLLAQFGFILRRANPGKAALGERLQFTSSGAVFTRYARRGSALYAAGLDKGDTLLTVAGKPFSDATILAAYKPGDRVALTYTHAGKTLEAQVTLIEDPTLEVVLQEQATTEVLTRRTDWLGSHALH